MIFASARHLFWKCFGPIAIYTTIVWAVTFILIAPGISWVLVKLGTYGGDQIVGNYTIPAWLLTSNGVAYVLVSGSALIFIIILNTVGIFAIGSSYLARQSVRIKQVLRQVLNGLPGLIQFSLLTCLVCLVAILILVSVPGLLFLTFLTSHDINYYLSSKPFEWYGVLGISVCWGGVWLYYTTSFLLRSLFLLPIWMSGVRPYVKAVQQSFDDTKGLTSVHLKVLGPCVFMWIFLPMLAVGSLYLVAGFLLQIMGSSINALLMIISVYFISSAIAYTMLSFMGMALTVCVWVVCYERHGAAASAPVEWFAAEGAMKMSTAAFRLLVWPSIAILIALSFGFSVYLLNRTPPNIQTLVIAHRTGPLAAPENTLSGMKILLEQSTTDYIEFDVQLTGDGQVTGAHDADLMKLADDPRKISETPYAELAQIDIGQKFDPTFAGEQLGLLSEFLELGKGTGIPLIIEFKFGGGRPDLVRKTIELVRRFEMEKDVILMSLEMPDVRFAQELAPDIRSGYFASIEMGSLMALDVEVLAPKSMITTPELVRTMKARGIPVYVWTVDDPLQMVEFIEMGVDGIITNDPNRGRKVVEELQNLGSVQRNLLKFRQFWKVFAKIGIWESFTALEKNCYPADQHPDNSLYLFSVVSFARPIIPDKV
jgi:glycerophosphoryl diester phosphodiesterase